MTSKGGPKVSKARKQLMPTKNNFNSTTPTHHLTNDLSSKYTKSSNHQILAQLPKQTQSHHNKLLKMISQTMLKIG